MLRPLLSLVASPLVPALLLGGGLPAQLTLSGDAGSYPGVVRLELRSAPVGRAGAILLSASPGPTPLRFIQPGDSRVLNVGLQGLVVLPSVFLPPGVLSSPPIPLPNNPSFLDAAIYMQGFELATNPPQVVARISQPQPMRLAPADRFRDRRTQFTTPRAFFPVIRRNVAATNDRRPMLIGGGTGALLAQIATKQTEIYDPLTDAFTAGPDMTTERSLHTATLLKDGRYLIVGGVDVRNDPQASAEIYDPARDTFTAVASMSTKRMGHTASLLPDGKVLVAGGLTKVSSQDILGTIRSIQRTTEIYDPVANRWTAGPSMARPRAAHPALDLPGGKVLMAGGLGFILIVPAIWRECEIYDPATNRFTAAASMSTGHAAPSFLRLDANRWMLAGGAATISLTQLGTPTKVAEIYDAAANRWTSAGNMRTARALHSAFALQRNATTNAVTKVLHVGGAVGTILAPIALASTEVYDVTSGNWSAGPTMSMSRTAYGAYVTRLGQIHLLGGGSGQSATVNNTTDWYYR